MPRWPHTPEPRLSQQHHLGHHVPRGRQRAEGDPTDNHTQILASRGLCCLEPPLPMPPLAQEGGASLGWIHDISGPSGRGCCPDKAVHRKTTSWVFFQCPGYLHAGRLYLALIVTLTFRLTRAPEAVSWTVVFKGHRCKGQKQRWPGARGKALGSKNVDWGLSSCGFETAAGKSPSQP